MRDKGSCFFVKFQFDKKLGPGSCGKVRRYRSHIQGTSCKYVAAKTTLTPAEKDQVQQEKEEAEAAVMAAADSQDQAQDQHEEVIEEMPDIQQEEVGAVAGHSVSSSSGAWTPVRWPDAG